MLSRNAELRIVEMDNSFSSHNLSETRRHKLASRSRLVSMWDAGTTMMYSFQQREPRNIVISGTTEVMNAMTRKGPVHPISVTTGAIVVTSCPCAKAFNSAWDINK